MTLDSPASPQVFFRPVPNWKRQQRLAEAALDTLDGAFPDLKRTQDYLNYIFTPVDGAWAFRPNGKTGTTTTLYFLFHLEFGVPLTANVEDNVGMNPDQAGHNLADARVFSTLIARADGRPPLEVLQGALRLTTVRHPMERALSGFLYLCKSDGLRSPRFARQRLRMNALAGFDWERHPNTPEGFVRFLEYLQIELDQALAMQMDSHFRPQVDNIRPDVFRPDLVGRTENMAAFLTEIADRLSRPVPSDYDLEAARNVAPKAAPLVPDAAARRLVADIFARDFEEFGYVL
ncbi:sulfotransferase family 2 domain-containing protein [Tropicimonas marinistellae]|uniref:sulfotransferase family 2 domain-containing protein n=1 Tax=Tropicimonas marinistellae TaxID=1739787 RepID=UPI00082E8C88|nr:sulfotransferase family 2 domain-containing protein [Tropicimonas marinistellae]